MYKRVELDVLLRWHCMMCRMYELGFEVARAL